MIKTKNDTFSMNMYALILVWQCTYYMYMYPFRSLCRFTFGILWGTLGYRPFCCGQTVFGARFPFMVVITTNDRSLRQAVERQSQRRRCKGKPWKTEKIDLLPKRFIQETFRKTTETIGSLVSVQIVFLKHPS